MAEEFTSGKALRVAVKRLQFCRVLKRGSDDGCALSSGSSGNVGRCGLLSYTNGAWAKRWLRKQPVARTVRGGSVTRPLSLSPCPMLTLARSVFLRWSV